MNIIKFIYRYLGPIIAANALIEMTIAELTRLYYLHNMVIAVIIWPWLLTWVPYFIPALLAIPMYYLIGSRLFRKVEKKLPLGLELMMWIIPILFLLPMIPYTGVISGWNVWVGSIVANLIAAFLIWHFLLYPLNRKDRIWLTKWATMWQVFAVVASFAVLVIGHNL